MSSACISAQVWVLLVLSNFDVNLINYPCPQRKYLSTYSNFSRSIVRLLVKIEWLHISKEEIGLLDLFVVLLMGLD